MTFNDIFKSSFLENVSEFSILDTVIGLAVALVIGLFIFIIYKKTLTGVLYSGGFALTLVGLSLVTTLVIMAVTSNVVLSLGMVGALSIVRFRTAIKEPVEIVFLFWSLAVGIVIGAGMIPLAVIGSAIIGVILLLFANRKIRSNPYMKPSGMVRSHRPQRPTASAWSPPSKTSRRAMLWKTIWTSIICSAIWQSMSSSSTRTACPAPWRTTTIFVNPAEKTGIPLTPRSRQRKIRRIAAGILKEDHPWTASPGTSGSASPAASTDTLILYGISLLVFAAALFFACLYRRRPKKR